MHVVAHRTNESIPPSEPRPKARPKTATAESRTREYIAKQRRTLAWAARMLNQYTIDGGEITDCRLHALRCQLLDALDNTLDLEEIADEMRLGIATTIDDVRRVRLSEVAKEMSVLAMAVRCEDGPMTPEFLADRLVAIAERAELTDVAEAAE